jgi:CNT family concentrative nucleoside transporter
MLIVFLALIAVINGVLGWAAVLCEQVDADGNGLWSLQAFLGTLFYPLAWLIGIETADCGKAAELMGLKMATNEFVAYATLADWAPIAEDGTVGSAVVSERTRQIMTYALCGFANFSSIGIQLGGIGGIAPDRRSDLAQLGLRAMVGGTLAAFMTACIASLLL